MCGRFSLVYNPGKLLERVGVRRMPEFKARYNIAPGQDALVVLSDQPEEAVMARWGLVPSWAKDSSIGNQMINARAETLDEKPAFRRSFEKQRCLIPADGFYEWDKAKDPFRFTLKGGEPFFMAGLYDRWRGSGKELLSFTIITLDPNAAVSKVHDRMPAILGKKSGKAWLREHDPAELKAMLQPYPDGEMDRAAVSRRLNSPANDDADVLRPEDRKLLYTLE
ncbi:MAG: SOS response-associated peptidase [Nanoarchaeota archaeon]